MKKAGSKTSFFQYPYYFKSTYASFSASGFSSFFFALLAAFGFFSVFSSASALESVFSSVFFLVTFFGAALAFFSAFGFSSLGVSPCFSCKAAPKISPKDAPDRLFHQRRNGLGVVRNAHG